jgi:tetraacyldisaccharide 4'-kinase
MKLHFRDRLEAALEALWYGRAPRAWRILLFGPLALASCFFRLGAARRRRRPFKHRSNRPVVSVGNLCVGGSGKTQVVLYLCGRAVEAGLRPAALLRGYRGRERGPVEVPPDGPSDRFGDEAILLTRRCPGARIIVARDRSAGALLAERLGARWIVVDDGLQQRDLEPRRSVVVLGAESPLGNGHLLPLGPLRDPPSRLRDEDAIWLHGEGPGLPGLPARFRSRSVPLGSVPVEDLNASPRSLQGRRLGAFAGIARPERFLKSLESAGASIVIRWVCGDHRVFREKELRKAAETAERLGAEALVCTEKDAVRLPPGLGPLPLPLLALRVSLQLDHGEPEVPGLLTP